MVPGEIYPITVDLWSTSYIFNPGHALRVDVSSSNAPRFAPNYNNGLPISNPGEPLIAANTVSSPSPRIDSSSFF
jgi:predicted acyl esterase